MRNRHGGEDGDGDGDEVDDCSNGEKSEVKVVGESGSRHELSFELGEFGGNIIRGAGNAGRDCQPSSRRGK